jgi:predicted tellurium resistance membrane protein TerC
MDMIGFMLLSYGSLARFCHNVSSPLEKLSLIFCIFISFKMLAFGFRNGNAALRFLSPVAFPRPT